MAKGVSPLPGSQTLENKEHPPEYTELRPVSVNTPSTSSSDIVNIYQMESNCDQIYGLQCEESCSQSHPGLLTHADGYNISHVFDPNSDFTSLDSNLQNLPKELYVGKLLEITNSNEHFIVDYRTYLFSKAKSIHGCPMGNLTARKTTKNNPSVIKYAKDCNALNMFCNGHDAYLGDVFDKSKNKTNELHFQGYGSVFIVFLYKKVGGIFTERGYCNFPFIDYSFFHTVFFSKSPTFMN